MQGRQLSPEAAKDLERKANADPQDLESRIQLLAYYASRTFRSPSARQAHQQLALWLIEKHPESPVAGLPEAQIHSIIDPSGYAKAKNLWLENVKVHDKKATVFANAAKFFQLSDRSTAEEFLTKAQALEPNNAEWSKQLGHLYQLGVHSATGNERREIAAKSMAQFERAMDQQEEPRQVYYLLANLAKVSFEAGSADKAKQYADQLLDMSKDFAQDWNAGNAIHHGNLVLGRLALQAGDIDKAKSYLLEAGKTPGSPQLNSFGPNMTLAKELLDKGEKEVILEYFQLCTKFWKSDKIDQWIAMVKDGGIPNFGGNLSY